MQSLLRFRYGLAGFLGQHPALYLPIIRLYLLRRDKGGTRLRCVSKKTDLVIEGFPRSANSFVVNAFRLAQDRPVEIAHHLHAAAHVIRAVRIGVPVLLLVRDPQGAVLSYHVRHPHIRVRQVLGEYVRFHRRVRPYRHGFVVATFDQATHDLGAVIRRLNAAFSTDFREFEHTDKNVRKCFDRIEQTSRRRFGGLREDLVARPSVAKEALKKAAATRLQAPALESLHEEAREIYEEFRSYADGSADPRGPSGTDAPHD